MVFASIGLMAVGARVSCIAMSGVVMASEVFGVSEPSVTLRTPVPVGFVFVVCDPVMAGDQSVM
jgi:hypothetical protein